MKSDSQNEYIRNLKNLFNILRKNEAKPKKPTYPSPIEAVIFSVLCEESPESKARAAIKKIQSHFVDFNDLRVARAEEIVEVIGQDIENAEKCANTLTALLNAIFQKYDTLSPQEMPLTGKRGIKETLEKFSGTTGFIARYVLLTVFNQPVIPLTEKMIQYLKIYKAVDAELENMQVASFVEKQIPDSSCYAFYHFVRHDSELASPKAGQLLLEKKPKIDKRTKK